MTPARLLDIVWFLLIALTLGGALLGESADPGLWVTVTIALFMAFKGRMVIDHFMELNHANHKIRRLVRLYAIVIPLMLILTDLFGPHIARLTALPY